MGMHCLVLEKPLDDKAEGTVIKVDDDTADALLKAGIAREAEAEDLSEDKDEDAEDIKDEEDEEEEETPSDAVMANGMRNLSADVRKLVAKATQQAVEKLTNKVNRPTIGKPDTGHFGRRIAGSDAYETGGFKSLGDAAETFIRKSKGDFNAAKKFARWENVLRTKTTNNYMSISGTHQGGDLVPQEWAKELWRLAFKDVVDLMGMCKRYPMQYQTLNIPSWVQPSPTTAIQASVTAEGSAITTTEGISATVQLALNKGTVLVSATDELLRFNAYALEDVIKSVAPERLRFMTNNDIVNGTNNGLNLVNNAATITQIAESPGHISYDDVIGMYAHLYDTMVNGAAWIVNQATIPALYSLSFPNRSSTYQYPAFTPGVFGQENLLGPAPIGQLLGLPVYRCENVPALGTRGGLILAHLPSCAAGYTDLYADKTNALYFNLAQDTFRFLFYYDTVNPMTQPYTNAVGWTQSNIVVLSAGSTSSS